MRLALTFVVVAACVLSCRPAPPTRPAPPVAPVSVAWRTLVRDRVTAGAYAGRRVRFHLDRADCHFDGATVRVWYADRNTPPTIVISAAEPPVGPGPFLVEGVCGEPVADGIRRAARIDFCVTISDARIRPR